MLGGVAVDDDLELAVLLHLDGDVLEVWDDVRGPAVVDLLDRVGGADRDDLGPARDTSFDTAWRILYDQAVLGVVTELLGG